MFKNPTHNKNKTINRTPKNPKKQISKLLECNTNITSP